MLDMWTDVTALLDYGFQAYENVVLVTKGEAYGASGCNRRYSRPGAGLPTEIISLPLRLMLPGGSDPGKASCGFAGIGASNATGGASSCFLSGAGRPHPSLVAAQEVARSPGQLNFGRRLPLDLSIKPTTIKLLYCLPCHREIYFGGIGLVLSVAYPVMVFGLHGDYFCPRQKVTRRRAREMTTRHQPQAKGIAPMRLQKFLAHAGVASRRASEELIQAGRVQVNSQTVTELGTKVVPGKDEVRVDG